MHIHVAEHGSRMSMKLVLSLLVAFSLPIFLHAQVPQVPQGKSDKVVTVATVNITDATVKQEGRTFTIDFSLSNRVGTQPGIRYGAMLIQKTEKGQMVVDQHVADDTVTLDEGESMKKTLSYTPPSVLSGTYGLVLVSRNENGFLFGMNYLGDFEVTKGGSAVMIDAPSCYLTVKGEPGGKKYTVAEGIDIGAGETLISHCMVTNTSDTEVNVAPVFKTYNRSLFGTLATVSGGDTTPVKLTAGEKRLVDTELPRASVPQAYDMLLTYGNGGNAVAIRYVVRGGSGTIQNLVFDKNVYDVGDTAQIQFTWSPSADGFDSARVESETPLKRPRVTIALRNGSGSSCAESVSYELDTSPVHTLRVPITALCEDPKVSVVLMDESSGILSNMNLTIDSPEREPTPQAAPVPETPKKSGMSGSQLILIAIVVLVVIVVIGAGVLALRARRTDAPPTTPTLLLIFGMGLLSALIGGVREAHADTYISYSWVPGAVHTITYTVNFNKLAYNPGEAMSLTASGVLDADCGNPCPTGVECRGSGLWVDSEDGVDVSPRQYIIPIVDGELTLGSPILGSLNRTASMTNGTHVLRIGATSVSQAEMDAINWWYTFDMYYGVGGPPNIPPTVDAGPDVIVTQPASSGSPQGATATDSNTPVSVRWEYTWGQTPTVGITGTTTLTPTFSGLTLPGQYFFDLIATDALGGVSVDTMEMQVTAFSGCPAATTTHCVLPVGADDDTAGTCESGYSGTCSFWCDAVVGAWQQSKNLCVPGISLLELCDPGFTNCASSRTVATGTPLVVRWQSSGTKCVPGSGAPVDFSTGNNASGNDAVTAATTSGTTRVYPIVCGDGTASSTGQVTAVTNTTATTPTITFVPKIVEKDNEVTISWDTNNGNETLCSLVGGTVNYASLPGGGDPETGSIDVTIQGRTPFTITCGAQVVTQVVDIVPTGWDS